MREAVIVLGLPAAPGDDDLVGLSVLEGRVVDQQGNAMAGGPPAWTNLKPESPEGPGCPWLGYVRVRARVRVRVRVRMRVRVRVSSPSP